ncbi:hypothetical protein LU604_25260 [Erwinia tracheiphila]|uniref:hypothetical protein n=1 Tax=Erwinia tracheiphila TaxID=65700 RepID=UPI001F28F5D7|nr:hypothetical protein [Erwinia tracheiphila]UIA83510.1 hypothetical protein LU604_25260 [Erwinia tracheiphila]UIA92094.1 hypothetical protein LU632_24725 [Erwinia tracheiphila]
MQTPEAAQQGRSRQRRATFSVTHPIKNVPWETYGEALTNNETVSLKIMSGLFCPKLRYFEYKIKISGNYE